MRSEDFFSEFYYPDEIVTESNVEASSPYFVCFAYQKPYNKQLNNLVCSAFAENIPDFGLKFLLYAPRPEARSIQQKFHPQIWNFTVKPSLAVIK